MNSAQRIRGILHNLRSYGGAHSTAVSSAWEHALQIPTSPGQDKDDVTVVALQAIRGEVALIITALSNAGVPDELFRGQLEGLRKLVQPKRMGEPWQGHHSVVQSQELDVVLGWAAHVLPDAEEELDESELSDLLEALHHLEACLQEAQLPETTRAFMSHQVDLLRRAVLLYPISGAKGIKRATSEAMGQAFTEKHSLERAMTEAPGESAEVVSRWGRILSKAADLCDKADRLDKVVDTGQSLFSKATQLIDWAKDAVSQIPT